MRAPDRSDPACRRVAAMTPAGWSWYVHGGRWVMYRHLDYIDAAIVETVASSGRLMIETPPRMGKSFLTSRGLPGWFLGRFPHKRVAVACGAASLAKRWGRMVRNDIANHGESVFGVRVHPEHAAAEDWSLDGHEGGMRSYGVGSQFSGEGADLLILDDLILDAEQAFSDTQRENVWEWIDSTAWPRLEPKAAVVSIMTRWHQDDPHGRFRERMEAEGWRTISLPALARDDDPIKRKPGEALCPERYDEEALHRIRAGKSPYFWGALYQQTPTPDEGGVWKRKWWNECRYREPAPGQYDVGGLPVPRDTCFVFCVVDMAFTEKRLSDYTAIGVFALTPERTRRLLLLDMIRFRAEGPDLNVRVKKAMQDYGAAVAYYEDEGTGNLTVIQLARREGIATRTVSRKADADVRIQGDKVLVAMTASPFVSAGRLWIPKDAPWVTTWEAEMLSFGPGAAHDDVADVTAWACIIADTVPVWDYGGEEAEKDARPAEDEWTRRDREEDERDSGRGSLRSWAGGVGPTWGERMRAGG